MLTGEGAMGNDVVNMGRRRFLVTATSVVGAAGAVGAAVPFVGSWFPSAKARAAGAPVKVNISKIEPGQQMIAEWRGQPVFIVRRTPEILSALGQITGQLSDPESNDSTQPAYVDPVLRSIRPEILLLIGICTHLGCSLTFRPEVASVDLGKDWVGGYFCPCHGSRYDLAGRVYKSQPAPLNLPVPPHSYESDSIIVIGVDQEQG
ncbi:ubiquinol-cytochrome c reductase iron-sulfur subunit [Pseudomonas graminis]|nr:ubiquinol-cytochrome c reductase iron-sulfur subunit [Pseudomonas graminis]